MFFSYNLKRLLSYIYPIHIETRQSHVSGQLEVSFQNGKLVLDTALANYSYGNLHRVFQEVIKQFKFNQARKNTLILGFGAGSIANILNQEKHLNLDIDGVELDHNVLDLYHNYFELSTTNRIELHNIDAIKYLEKCSKVYDYIFIDVFKNLNVPEEILSLHFVKLLKKVSDSHTQIAMNSMLKDDHEFVVKWFDSFGKSAKYKRYDLSNLVLFA